MSNRLKCQLNLKSEQALLSPKVRKEDDNETELSGRKVNLLYFTIYQKQPAKCSWPKINLLHFELWLASPLGWELEEEKENLAKGEEEN